MKEDKKKAKTDSGDTKGKAKGQPKAKGKHKTEESRAPKKTIVLNEGEIEREEAMALTQELKLLPSPRENGKAKAGANVSRTGQEVERRVPIEVKLTSSERSKQQKSVHLVSASPKEGGSTSTGNVHSQARVKANSAKDAGQAQNGATEALKEKPKHKVRPIASEPQERGRGNKAAIASSQAEQSSADTGDKAEAEDLGDAQQARVQERSRLKIKSTSAAQARQGQGEKAEKSQSESGEKGRDGKRENGRAGQQALIEVKHSPKISEAAEEKPNLKKSTLIIAAACVGVLVIGYALMSVAPKRGGPPGGPGFGGEASVVSVRTTVAQVATLHDYVETNGEIECERSVDCYPDIGGKIARVYVALGDRVWKGRALAEIDPNEPGTYYVNSVVYAPIAGMITSTPKDVGTTVTTTSSITTIGDVTRLQIRAHVPEKYVAFLKAGLKANIILEAYPEETFIATVTKVSPVVDAESRTKEILLRFDQSDDRINAGMFAKITLFTADYEGTVVVPSTSVVEKTGGKQNVFVLAAGGQSVSLREVETGKSVDNMIQILSGLNEGEQVVIEGMTSLSDGASVRDITAGLPQGATQELKASDTAMPPPGAGGPPPEGAPSGAKGVPR